MIGEGAYIRAIADGIMAQRKLDDGPDVFATDDIGTLQAIVDQGKRAEQRCRDKDLVETLEYARCLGRGQFDQEGGDGTSH